MAFTTENFVLLDGVEMADGTVVLATQHPDYDPVSKPHTAVVYRARGSDEWQPGGFFSRPTSSMDLNPSGDAAWMIDNDAVVAQFRPEGGSKFEVRPVDRRYYGHATRFIRSIGDLAIAGGAGYSIHISERGGPWVDSTTEAMEQAPETRIFEDAGGFGPEEFYCVGWGGAIWARISGTWSQVDSPTNVMLSCVGQGRDRMYAAGKIGTIIEGRGSDWRIFEHDETDQQILDIATHGNATFLSGFFGLLRLEDDTLSVEWTINPSLPSAGVLFQGPSGLWSVGSRTLALYDGETWTTVLET